MARMAYVMDRFMHRLGLHGKSSLPLFLGFGCNIPAVLGTRIIEDRRARLLTLLLAPLVPCTARLAVVTFLAPAFFGELATWVMVGLVALNLLVLVVVGVALNKLAFRGAKTAFIMEMPLYHVPNVRTIGLFVWNNVWAFLRKAGTVIVVVAAIVWALSSWPGPGMENSVLAVLGRALTPIGAWIGVDDWRFIVALLTSFVAKENTIATLGRPVQRRRGRSRPRQAGRRRACRRPRRSRSSSCRCCSSPASPRSPRPSRRPAGGGRSSAWSCSSPFPSLSAPSRTRSSRGCDAGQTCSP